MIKKLLKSKNIFSIPCFFIVTTLPTLAILRILGVLVLDLLATDLFLLGFRACKIAFSFTTLFERNVCSSSMMNFKSICLKMTSQLTFTCSNSTIETLEKAVRHVQN